MNWLNKLLSIIGVLLLGLLLVPDFVLAGRIESIATEISSGDAKKIEQLKTIGITAGLFISLLVMFHLALEKKGIKRFGAFLGIILLAAALYSYHFT